MKRVLILALAVSLSACATTSGTSIAVASATITQIQGKYDAAKGLARLFMPFLPDDRRAQIEAIGAAVERALSAARLATTLAEQRAAIERAEAEADRFRLVTGG